MEIITPKPHIQTATAKSYELLGLEPDRQVSEGEFRRAAKSLLDDLLIENNFLITYIVNQFREKPNLVPVVVDPETKLILGWQRGYILASIPTLEGSIAAFHNLTVHTDPDTCLLFSSDGSWKIIEQELRETGKFPLYDGTSVAPEEYLTGTSVLKVEPIRSEYNFDLGFR